MMTNKFHRICINYETRLLVSSINGVLTLFRDNVCLKKKDKTYINKLKT